MGAGLFSSAQPSYAAVRAGTLAPFLRALLRPMAIACLRFFTRYLPDFMWSISVRTSCWAFLPYLRGPDFLLLERDDDLFFDGRLSCHLDHPPYYCDAGDSTSRCAQIPIDWRLARADCHAWLY